jgi:MFS family permease
VGGLYLIGAVRAIKLPADPAKSAEEIERERQERETRMSLRQTLRWLFGDRQLFSVILLGAIVTALYEAFTTMTPLYVSDVLGADPANAIYIFAPASIGFLIGTIGGPWLMARFGEQRLLVFSVMLSSAGIIAFGMIGLIGPLFAPFSPLRLLEPFGVELSTSILAASVLAIPTNLGSSLASACVQVYINRNVAVSSQGRLFGSQEVLKNLLNIITVMATGLAATVLSLEQVLVLTPAIVIVVVLQLIGRVGRGSTGHQYTRQEAWEALMGQNEETDSNARHAAPEPA